MRYLSPFSFGYACLVAGVLGACLGSFLNCLAWRAVHGESALRGRSHCDSCGHVLGVRDLIPIVSFFLAKGRCRYCGARLSSRHVWAEAVMAAVFVSLLLRYDISLQTLEAWLAACVLAACAFADLEGYIIPDRFVAVGIVLFIAGTPFANDPGGRLFDGALGGFGVAGGLTLLVLFLEKRMGREAMGGGDLKLLFLTGLYFGWKENLLCLFLACVIGIVWGLAGKKTGGKAIAWGPSIALAAWLTALAGESVIRWYLSLL